MSTRPTILVVESDEAAREIISSWLLAAGYVVMPCPGPLYPEYECIAGRAKLCPLMSGSDIVILNMELASDYAMTGTSGRFLLGYYLEHAKRVIARIDPGDPLTPRPDQGLYVVQKNAPRDTLLAAVRSALDGKAA